MEIKSRKSRGVVVSNEVIVNIAKTAALDVDGVAAVVSRPANIKSIVRINRINKAVLIKKVASGIDIDIYIKIKSGYKIEALAENVQKNVKESVQSMACLLINKVGVHIVSIDLQSIKNDKS